MAHHEHVLVRADAVSSIVTYDTCKTYINPNVTGKQLMRGQLQCHGMLRALSSMATFPTVFSYIGISMGYLPMS